MREALGEDIEPRLRGLLQGHAEAAAVANEFSTIKAHDTAPGRRPRS
jgi:hypothetical protein